MKGKGSNDVAVYIGIGILAGLIIGGSIGAYYMVYYLELMKVEGIYPRDQIIEILNRKLNSGYEYEEWHDSVTPVYLPAWVYENGTMIKPPICYGVSCPFNFSGVVEK